MAKSKRIRRSVAVWRKLISGQASSGLSVPEFCRRERVNASLFRRWRRMLKDADPGTQARRVVQPAAQVAAPFIDLGGIGSGSRFEVRLDFGTGMVLSIARG